MIFKKTQSQEKNFRKAQNLSGKKLLQGSQKRNLIKAVPKPYYFQTSRKKLFAPNPAQLLATLPA